MGYLKYVKQAFRKPTPAHKQVQKDRMVQYRKEPVTVRVDNPTRPDRARALGYKAKHGIIVVRQRVGRGRHTRPDIKQGRRPKRFHQRKDLSKNYQQIAEERANKKYANCEVLGSYEVGKDGKHHWYEVILVDRRHPEILADKRFIGIAAQKGRANRGVTSAGRRSRGLHKKGKGVEKNRPSLRANKRLH
ncbi:MAG: 50S ribosomal protein L15e [Candidatus Woesearchaeota archaeon]|nr:50S ribosomal protein L15e [Candidatus Woesearchaeota archaeon]